MSVEYAISLTGIQKSFASVKVLDDVNFRLRKGSVHALVGQNGAGKSTLMKILTGVYSCDEGVIEINGKKAIMHDYSDAISHGVSLIFQEMSLIPTLTVAENIFLNREPKKNGFLDYKRMEEEANKLLQALNVQVNVKSQIRDLDVGICQIIEIAKALSVNADVLIMDEPTASLSEKETQKLFEVIKDLQSKGVSIVYISHRMEELFAVCEEITVLRDGKIVASASTSEYTMESLIEKMIGKEYCKESVEQRVPPQNVKKTLEVSHLSWGHAIKDISFNLYEGEILGFAGLMGSGRTETVESLFGLNQGVSGEVMVKGEPYAIKSCKEAIRAGIALVPEDRRRQGLVLIHSVKDNLILPNLAKYIKKISLQAKLVMREVAQSIKHLSIRTSGPNAMISSLSGGNQQKVVISK